MIDTPDMSTQSAQLIYDALSDLDVEVNIISKKNNLLEIVENGKSFFVKSTSFPVNPQPSCIIANNKFLTKKVLRKYNVRVPKSFLASSIREAKDIITQKNIFPCVIKPTSGAHGNQVFPNIESLEELLLILPQLNKNEKQILIEEYIEGDDYRVLVVGDEISAVMERIPAHVVGDGKKTIKELVTQFNKHPLVGKKYEKPMCKIKINDEVLRILEKQKRKLSYIPQKTETVWLRENANISTGGIGKDATENAPKKVKDIALKAAAALGMKIAGVDVIYNPKLKMAYLIELNDIPGIDIHHFPVLGEAQNVAKDIAEYLVRFYTE